MAGGIRLRGWLARRAAGAARRVHVRSDRSAGDTEILVFAAAGVTAVDAVSARTVDFEPRDGDLARPCRVHLGRLDRRRALARARLGGDDVEEVA